MYIGGDNIYYREKSVVFSYSNHCFMLYFTEISSRFLGTFSSLLFITAPMPSLRDFYVNWNPYGIHRK